MKRPCRQAGSRCATGEYWPGSSAMSVLSATDAFDRIEGQQAQFLVEDIQIDNLAEFGTGPEIVLNGSAGEIRGLALPGHTFRVLELDGNPVPTPATVPVLWVGTAERVSALVEMNHPAVWVMGDLSDDDRTHGMGIVVEYAGSHGKPQWSK